MKEVVHKLALAMQYAHHANFAGTARQAIADGYSAVDAVLSALLEQDKIKPPLNHKQKLDLARNKYPNALDAKFLRHANGATYTGGAEWASLETYYKQWLQSRYERFELSAAEAHGRVTETHQVINAALRFIARKAKTGVSQLDGRVRRQAFGYDTSELSQAVGNMHDRLFSEAEQFGEMHGAKLGTKLASTTNYCELYLTASDSLTQTIIKEDEELAREGARLYAEFNRLAEKIITKRLERLGGSYLESDLNQEALNESTNFMLSLKMRFHGATVKQTGEGWARSIGFALESILGKLKMPRAPKR